MNQPKTELWWLQRLQTFFEQLGVTALSRQSTRGVRVRRLDIQPGQISARLQDRELGDGSLEIYVDLLSDQQWQSIIEQMSDQASFAAQLLSEQLPPELESIFLSAGVALIPQSTAEIELQTNYPESGHVRILSGLYTALVDLLQSDPWLLLLLRGRHRESILHELRQSRNEGTVAVARPSDVMRQADAPYFYHLSQTPESPLENLPLAVQLEHFWGDSRQLRSLHHYVAAPTVELALLRRLGPIGQSSEWQAFHEDLSTIYRRVTDSALTMAYEVHAKAEGDGEKGRRGDGEMGR